MTSTLHKPTAEDTYDDRKNLETFSLVWFDENSTDSSSSFLELQENLRQSINYIKVFSGSSFHQCEQWIRGRQAEQEKVVLVVTSSETKEMIQRVYQLPQLVAIYIYYQTTEDDVEWWKTNYGGKVCGVITTANDLIAKLTEDQKQRDYFEEATAIMPVAATNEKSVSELNKNFLQNQVFLSLLLRMKPSSHDERAELITLWKQMCIGNRHELKVIEEFERMYTREKAIWWYTRQNFLHRALNKAIKTQDINILIAFRFFIIDLYLELKEHQPMHTRQLPLNISIPIIPGTTNVDINEMTSRMKRLEASQERSFQHVYRGQLMLKSELDQMKLLQGQYIVFATFLSTTLDRHVALSFISSSSSSPSAERVLFEIEINSFNQKVKPYANISSQSYCNVESKVLFMSGPMFKIDGVSLEDDNNSGFWVVKLKLENSENLQQLKQLHDYVKQHPMDKDLNIFSLACILYDMGYYEKAVGLFEKTLTLMDRSDWKQVAAIYSRIAGAALKAGKQGLALDYFQKAIQLTESNDPFNYKTLAMDYNNLANVYAEKPETIERSLVYYNKSLELKKKIYNENDSIDISVSYNNLAHTYYRLKRFDEAIPLYERALKIREHCLPSSHYQIGNVVNNLAAVYLAMNELDRAMELYLRADKIFRHSLSLNHPSLVNNYNNVQGLRQLIRVRNGESISPEDWIWFEASCDGCMMSPLIGPMYSCKVCLDGIFVLCKKCQETSGHEHELQLTPLPSMDESKMQQEDKELKKVD